MASAGRLVRGMTTLLLCMLLKVAPAAETCTARGGSTVMPLVELYTSEGCSSCPPADRWLSRQLAGRQANFLAFHVDYWDQIGWPDRFASPRYSLRQRERVEAAGQRAVFTPQVMVGRVVQAQWHGARSWEKTLQMGQRPAGAALTLRLSRVGTGWNASVGAASIDSHAKRAQLWVARYVDGQSSQVRAGENRGATLRHDRVVRQLSGPWPLSAGSTLSRQILLPPESGEWGVTAFVQDVDGTVLQSVSVPAHDCLAETGTEVVKRT